MSISQIHLPQVCVTFIESLHFPDCCFTLLSPLLLIRLPFWCEVVLTSQKVKPVKCPSPNYSHPARLPSICTFTLAHKTRNVNYMSLQYSGQTKSSIIGLKYAPLIKVERCAKWLTVQFSAGFCAILVTSRRWAYRGGNEEFTFTFLLKGSFDWL